MWEYIEYLATVIGFGALLIVVMALFVLLIAVVSSFFKPRPKDKCCETCRFYKFNCTEEPCICCEDGDCYQRNNLDGQEDLD
jgi:hypothetical protein